MDWVKMLCSNELRVPELKNLGLVQAAAFSVLATS